MADQERFGDITGAQFRQVREAATEAIANLREYKSELASFDSPGLKGLASSLQEQVNLASKLSSINSENLASEVKKQSFIDQLNKAKTKEADLTKQIAAVDEERRKAATDLANKIQQGYNLNGKVVKQARELLRERQAEQQVLLATQETTSNLVKDAEALVAAVAEAASKTKLFDNLLAGVRQIPVLGQFLQGPFQQAAQAAALAAKAGAGKFNTFLKGGTALAKGLAEMLGPAAVLGALFKVSDQTAQINRQLGLGLDAASKTRDRFAEIAQQSGSSRYNTEKLIQANAALNQQLGTSVEFSGNMLKDFVQLTQYMGLSAESAGKLSTLGKITGQDSKEFAGNIALSVASAGKANGIFVSTSSALEKIKNLSGTTLLNLQRNPKAIGEAIVATEKLGMSFQQLRSTADSLLNFEQSISNELEAELLTGKQLNLERARAAALRGDDVALAKELASQVGTVAQYEKMNVIQRQSLAQAFGMTADQMADMLMKQELMNKLGKEAGDLSSEQARKVKELMDANKGMTAQEALLNLQSQESATQKFQDAVAKLRNVFTDIVAFLSPVIDKFGSFISTIASSGIAKTLLTGGIAVSLGLALKNMVSPRGSSPANPLYTATGAAAGGSMFGGMWNAGTVTDKNGKVHAANSPQGKMIQTMGGQKPTGRGLTTAGWGMAGGIGGMAAMMGGQALSAAGHETAGGFLSGAGTGAMMGAMFGPWGIGIGAALGGIAGILQNQEKEKEKKEKTQEDKYDEMIKLMRAQAEKDVDIYMDSNKVGQQIVVGGYQVNNKINHT